MKNLNLSNNVQYFIVEPVGNGDTPTILCLPFEDKTLVVPFSGGTFCPDDFDDKDEGWEIYGIVTMDGYIDRHMVEVFKGMSVVDCIQALNNRPRNLCFKDREGYLWVCCAETGKFYGFGERKGHDETLETLDLTGNGYVSSQPDYPLRRAW